MLPTEFVVSTGERPLHHPEPMRRVALAVFCALTATACRPAVVRDLPTGAPETIDSPAIPPNAFEILDPDFQTDLCDPANDQDRLTDVFCAPGATPPTGLADLLDKLGLGFHDPAGGNGVGGNPGFALLAHSSAFTARKVSSITPAAFVFTPPDETGNPPADYTFVAYDPGEHFVEVAANATAGDLNFYLVLFDQACDSQPGGCTNADLLTQKVTTGWTNVRAYEDTSSLGNTIASCAVCHQPSANDDPILRMQEIQPPFTHWMSMQTEGGVALYEDFRKSHSSSEDYGPIPASLVDRSDPALMAAAIGALGFGDQPNAFPSDQVESEVRHAEPAQPWVNVPVGASESWRALEDAAVDGQQIAPPYHDVKVTDPAKLDAMSQAWRDYMGGTRADLPDIREVFLDAGLRDMGFAPRAGLDGPGLLSQMCEECHNTNLDMTITRERFRVDDFQNMDRPERDLAIQRLNLGMDTRLRMPPPLFRTITARERALMTTELAKDP